MAKQLASIDSTEKYMSWLTYLQSTWNFDGWLENDLIQDFNKTNFTLSEFDCDKDDLIGSEICLFIQPSFEIKRKDCGNILFIHNIVDFFFIRLKINIIKSCFFFF